MLLCTSMKIGIGPITYTIITKVSGDPFKLCSCENYYKVSICFLVAFSHAWLIQNLTVIAWLVVESLWVSSSMVLIHSS